MLCSKYLNVFFLDIIYNEELIKEIKLFIRKWFNNGIIKNQYF